MYYDGKCVMENLVGRVVTGLFVNDDQSLLVVRCGDERFIYQTENDCCSECWIADIVGVCNLIGATVVAVEDVELESVEDGRTRQEYDYFYGIKLTTSRGYVDIVYRASSNGYYGGSLERAGERSLIAMNLVEITDDYSA